MYPCTHNLVREIGYYQQELIFDATVFKCVGTLSFSPMQDFSSHSSALEYMRSLLFEKETRKDKYTLKSLSFRESMQCNDLIQYFTPGIIGFRFLIPIQFS